MNIQQIILPADDWHTLVNKHTLQEVGRHRPCTKGPQYILLRVNLAMSHAADDGHAAQMK